MDNELILFDRLNVIKDTINKYGEENFYLSFSGGKDSTVLHHLLDMALPGNKIPRVYANTGIEYQAIVEFVKSMQKTDDRIKIIQPQQNIKQVLEKYGYPFKSKMYSHFIPIYRKNADLCDEYFKMVEEKPELLDDYDFIHNLPPGAKAILKHFYGKREREREICTATKAVFPNSLKYQFNKDFTMNISDKCCLYMKEKPLDKWQRENGKTATMTAIMAAEGGRREQAKCQVVKNGRFTFNPLVKITPEWEQWFIDKYNIQLCKLYYDPYNFERTGCKGCPFALHLQEELEVMEKYLPNERKQCEIIWKPVYDEYRRIGYRLKKDEQLKLF